MAACKSQTHDKVKTEKKKKLERRRALSASWAGGWAIAIDLYLSEHHVENVSRMAGQEQNLERQNIRP